MRCPEGSSPLNASELSAGSAEALFLLCAGVGIPKRVAGRWV